MQLLMGSSGPDGEEGLDQEGRGMPCWGGTSTGLELEDATGGDAPST